MRLLQTYCSDFKDYNGGGLGDERARLLGETFDKLAKDERKSRLVVYPVVDGSRRF
jgi:hypothetical protein